MKIPARRKTSLTSRRGFNLIEAAIVLGVVGLVIGGIWVAADAVMMRMRIKQTTEGIYLIAKELNETLTSPPYGAITDTYMAAVISKKPLPAGWQATSDPTTYHTPSGDMFLPSYGNIILGMYFRTPAECQYVTNAFAQPDPYGSSARYPKDVNNSLIYRVEVIDADSNYTDCANAVRAYFLVRQN